MEPAVRDVAPSFETQARQVMQRVRTAVAELILPLVGTRAVRSADLVEALGVDNRLAWKFAKIVERDDALGSVRYVPGPRGVKLFLQAARRRNATPSALKQAQRAFAALDELIQAEAGDRRSFDMMVAGHARPHQRDVDLEHRKGAFEHNSFIWGVQARAQVHTYLIQPSGDGAHLDAAVIRGFIDLRRIRPNIAWRISRFYTVDDTGQIRGSFVREPLGANGDTSAVPLLDEFCSQPRPVVRHSVGPHGVVDYILAAGDVGNTPAVTCVTGEIIRRAEPCYPDERHAALCAHAPLRTPCEAVIVDLLLDREFFGKLEPRLSVLSDMFADTLGMHYSESDRLSVSDHVEHVGSGANPPRAREIPRYPEMIRYAFERLGWDANRFDVYRARLRYPPIPVALEISCRLPARPVTAQ